MKNLRKTAALFATLISATLLITLSGCDALLTATIEYKDAVYDISGKVINSRSSTQSGVSGVAVTLTSTTSSTTYTATSDSNGNISIADMISGPYNLTGSKDGYFIAPNKVEITSDSLVLPSIQAFALDFNDYYGLSFITVWNGTVNDIDSYLTYPLSSAGISSWSTDLFPSLPSTGRGTKDYTTILTTVNQGLTNLRAVYMDVDARLGYGPETINLVVNPYDWFTANDSSRPVTVGSSTFGFDSSVFAAGSYYYQGTSAFYLDAYSTGKNLSNGVNGAEAKVYVIQTVPNTGVTTPTTNSQVHANLLGVYTIPASTTIEAASVVRVNIFSDVNDTEFFQIIPDIRIMESTAAFRSLNANPGIICLQGRSR